MSSTNRLRSSSAINKWSTKMKENLKKGSLRTSSTLDTGWNQDLPSHPLRSTASSNIYQSNTVPSKHDFKRSEEKTSEETILIEVDSNVDDYLINPDIKNVPIKQKNDALLGRNYGYICDYPNLNVTQAMLAMQKLQRLKELQRKRDLTEKYYSHEIRKLLIGDYCHPNPRTELSPLKYNYFNNNNNNNRIQRSNFLQPYLESGTVWHDDDDHPSGLRMHSRNDKTYFHHDDRSSSKEDLQSVAGSAQPPINTGTRLYLQRSKEGDSKCDNRGFQTDKNRYMQLANKERKLQDELIAVNHEMANLTTTLLDSSCESDNETMKSLYEIDYQKRGLPIIHYRILMAAVDSPIGAPIKPAVTDLKNAYRDPTRFRYSAIERPTIEPAKTINLLAEIFTLWKEPFTGKTEYEDNISKMGLCNMRNLQQYLDPLPSSRNRFGDCRLQ
ncbi:PREDICTED: uncharacterized protein LOC107072476 isoform X3 [Polistes dominula]|uniref:Uncharacterized protein LOC107072476 isoform X3 n=1 Tax=Polistes dominula TaxID=743375 RepID=A0ABM1J655_POLDO|nr:PREDICTED: uncharacterized protein LOC107072476 isoform X3 [Polistes dominula]